MASTYVVRFNLMPAEEAGVVTGHASVTLQEISDQGSIVTNQTFAVSSDAGNLFTWTVPYIPLTDGYFGLEHPDLVALANSPDATHAYVSVDQSTYSNILNFVTSPPDGSAAGVKSWSAPGYPSYEVNYSLSGIGGYSCISFANAVYSMVPGMAGNNALALFTTEQLTSLPVNEISRWYGGYTYLRAIGATGEIDDSEFQGIVAPCFAADTPILLADGTSIAIEDIRVGTRVAAFDERDAAGAGELRAGLVTRLIPDITTEWIVLDDGTRVTPGHRYLRPDGSFMAIADIVASDGLVVDAHGRVTRVTGSLVRATDVGSDATWIEPDPIDVGGVVTPPADNIGALQLRVAQAEGA